MKNRILLSTVLLTGMGLTTTVSVQAQTPKRANVIGNIAKARFVVNEPSTISGSKTFTLATWGADGSTPYIEYPVEKAYDTLAAATLTNSPSFHPLTGKFALIFRGGSINFSDKVSRAQAAGAAGVIIVNNVAGDPIGMAATPTTFTSGLPVLMVTDVDGMAMNNLVKAGTVVKVSLGKWAMGATHDLGLLTSFQATPHALNIPISQMTGSAGTKEYLQYVGGAVANYGTATETGITVTDSVFWTPTSGTASYVTSHSYTIASLAPTDSVAFGFGAASYSITPPTTTGQYDHKYSIAYGNTDENPGDNVGTLTAYVTDSVFCRGRYDVTNMRPRTTIGYAPVDASGAITGPYMWGSMMYVKNGAYAAKTIQASLSIKDGGALSGLGQPWAYLYKWTDTAGGAPDSLVSVSELTGIGLGTIVLTSADTSGDVLNFGMRDFNNPVSGKKVLLEDNTWYWVVIEAPLNSYLGCEEGISPFTRIYSQYVLAGGGDAKMVYDRDETFGLLDKNTLEDLKGTNPTALLANYPFSGNSFFVDSMFYDRYKSVPSIALITSTSKITAINDVTPSSFGNINVYPNPTNTGFATIDVNLDKKFDKVQYKVIDAIGRTVFYEAHQNVQKEKFNLNTSSYAPGNYYLLIVTDEGIVNKKITVQK